MTPVYRHPIVLVLIVVSLTLSIALMCTLAYAMWLTSIYNRP